MNKFREALKCPKWIAALIGCLTFAYGYSFITLELDARHVALMAKPAMDILDGKNLFSETYFYQGTLYPYMIALFFGVFGESAYVLNLAGLLAYCCIGIVLILLWSRMIDHKGLWLSGLFWIAHLPLNAWRFIAWNSIYALLAQLLLLFFFVKSVEQKKSKFLAIAGFMLAMVWSYRWTAGVTTIFGFFVFLSFLQLIRSPHRLSMKSWGLFVGGFITGLLPSILYLVASDAGLDWYRQTLLGKAIWAQEYGSPIVKNPFLIFGWVPKEQYNLYGPFIFHWIWKVLPILAITFLFQHLHRAWKTKNSRPSNPTNEQTFGLAFSFVLIVSWHQYFPVPCTRHMFWAMSLGFFLPYYLSYNLLLGPTYRRARIAIVAVLAGLILFESGHRFQRGILRLQETKKMVKVQNPEFFSGLNLRVSDFQYFVKISHLVSAVAEINPSIRFFAYVHDPAPFLADQKIESFHQVFFDAHDLAFKTYQDYIPRLTETLVTIPAFWLVDFSPYMTRIQSIIPNVQSIATIDEKLLILYNPALISTSEVEQLKAKLREIAEQRSLRGTNI